MSEAKKKKWEELRKPFAKNVVKPAPKGKFGSYVPHHIYTRRLVDSGLPYSFRTIEVHKGTEGYVIAVVCELDIDGNVVGETGDVDQNVYTRVKNGTQSEGELVKFAVSDAFKRCMMRHGVGLELWEQDLSEEEHQIGSGETEVAVQTPTKETKKKQVTPKTGTPHSEVDTPVADQLNSLMEEMVANAGGDKSAIQKQAYAELTGSEDPKKRLPKEVEDWDSSHMGIFMDEFERLHNIYTQEKPFVEDTNIDTTVVDEVFGNAEDKAERQCPECKSTKWIVDARPKKNDPKLIAENPKIKNIPDFKCENWGDDYDGCGWGDWVGTNSAIPDSWL